MTDKVLRLMYRERYLVWGTVVVSFTTMMTGLFLTSVIGYAIGVGAFKALDWLVK